MANMVSQQALKNVQATEKLLGTPINTQIKDSTIAKAPDLAELMPGVNVENLAKALQSPRNDSFHRS